jgi:hypothetical protein
MKNLKWFLVAAFILFCLYMAIIVPAEERSEKHRRAELFLLDAIKTGVSLHLDKGGQLPTNWMTLSNLMDWSWVMHACEYNHLPPPTESYVVLAHPVTNTDTGGLCFLLSSQPTRWPAQGVGRWALIAWPTEFTNEPGPEYRVLRTWLPEDQLSPKILSQLGAQK